MSENAALTHPVFADPQQLHVDAAKAVFESGDMFVTDFVMCGILNRSLDLTRAMRVLLEAGNLTAAIPLLRLQLDNLLRLTYMVTLSNADEFSHALMAGKRMTQITDADGKALTDKRLRHYARTHYPWIDKLYSETSKLVHFSDRSIFRSIEDFDSETRHVGFRVGEIAWPARIREEVEQTFGYITGQVISIVEQWGRHKMAMRDLRTHSPDSERVD